MIVRGPRRSSKTAFLRHLERVLRQQSIATEYVDISKWPGSMPRSERPAVWLVDEADNLKSALDILYRQADTRWVLAVSAGSALDEL